LTHDLVDKHVIGGFARDDRFAYPSIFVGGLITITPSVLVEAGIQSGKYPVETRTIRSLLGDYLEHQGRQDIAEDTGAFELRVLHFRRTFVEKMFAIHGKVERFRTDGERVGRNSRHYADLYVLGEKDEVLQMLKSAEYADICKDYDEKSRQYVANSYRPPQGLRFRDSPALFPAADLRRELERDYDALKVQLFRDDRDEHAAFLYAGRHETAAGSRLLVRRVVPVADADFGPSDRGAYRQVSARAVARAALECDEAGLCLLWAHSHPLSGSSVDFSGDDLRAHAYAHPALIDMTHGRPVAGLIFGKASVAGEIWTRDAAPARLAVMAVLRSLRTSIRRSASSQRGIGRPA